MHRPAASRPSDPLLGATVLDGYHVVARERSDARGEVYRATSPEGAPVRLKLLAFSVDRVRSTDVGAWDLAARMPRLDHPNVERVLDCGLVRVGDGERLCVAAEEVEGPSLHARVREAGPLLFADALMIAQQVAQGLAAGHRLGLVHGDLRATNVLLARAASNDGSDARAVLCDFGLTGLALRALGASASLREMMGAPESIAPEQIRGEPATPATDVYAFGALLYRLLTGAAPFVAANTTQVLRAHLTRTVPPMRERRADADVPAVLEALVRRCLAKRPEDRPQSVDALLAGLQECEAAALTMASGATPSWVTPLHVAARVTRDPSRPTPPAMPAVADDPSERPTPAPVVPAPPPAVAPQAPVAAPQAPAVAGSQAPPVVTPQAPPVAAPQAPAAVTPAAAPRVATRLAVAVALLCAALGGYALSGALDALGTRDARVDIPRTWRARLRLAPRAPERVRFEVSSSTRAALLAIRGRTYPTPIAVEIAPGTEPEMVELTAPGHVPRRLWMVLDRPLRMELDLDPEAPAPAPVILPRHDAPRRRVDPAPAPRRARAPRNAAPRAPSAPAAPAASPPAPAPETFPCPSDLACPPPAPGGTAPHAR